MKISKRKMEAMHKDAHWRHNKNIPDHKAGYDDVIHFITAEKIINEILDKVKHPDLSIIQERLYNLEYEMRAFRVRAEEMLSKGEKLI